jgi:hypothetical protein
MLTKDFSSVLFLFAAFFLLLLLLLSLDLVPGEQTYIYICIYLSHNQMNHPTNHLPLILSFFSSKNPNPKETTTTTTTTPPPQQQQQN